MKNTIFNIEEHTVHLWRVRLTDFFDVENHYLEHLSVDEVARAEKFRFFKHRQRFVIARGMLRQILSKYIGLLPQEIVFSYGEHGKPYLKNNDLNLQFNVSHSEDVAVYALTKNVEIGVDIQKIEPVYHEAIVKRFFSQKEYDTLSMLEDNQRCKEFYQLWAYKEALIKAAGKGLFISLGDFSIDLHKKSQWVSLTDQKSIVRYYVENIEIYPFYCAAFATAQCIKKKINWEWALDGPELMA